MTLEAATALQRLCRWSRGEQLLPLTPEALAAFERFGRANVAASADLAGKAAAWWGKGPSQVLRLAGVLTFLAWTAQPQGTAEPQQVPAWAVEAAARLWRDHLWPHAQATFRIAGAGAEREDRKRQVLRWLQRQRLRQVSREQLRREALSQALDAAGTTRLIEELAEGGWLRELAPANGGRGRRRRRWDVHPGLWLDAHQIETLRSASATGASPAAQANGEVAAVHPDDPAPAVLAISASESNTAATAAVQVERRGELAPDAHRVSSGASADVQDASSGAPPEGGVAAAAELPAISASDSDSAMHPAADDSATLRRMHARPRRHDKHVPLSNALDQAPAAA